MPLAASRFKHFPEAMKIVTLTITVVLMIYLETIKERPPGVSMIWASIGISLLFEICTIAIILKEYDIDIMAIRMMPYAAVESVGSIFCLISYVISAALSISSEEVTDDFAFLIAAILCFIISLSYLTNLILNVRKWLNGSHLANPSSLYEYQNYGEQE